MIIRKYQPSDCKELQTCFIIQFTQSTQKITQKNS